jgi:hypothetical protein
VKNTRFNSHVPFLHVEDLGVNGATKCCGFHPLIDRIE